MDIYSNKLPLILIIIVGGILVFQFLSNDNQRPIIDSETCELYVVESQLKGRTYLDEFDSKCLEFKNLNP